MSEGARARLGETEDEEGEESVEEEDSGETEVADALENAPEVSKGSNLAPTNQPLVSQSDPSILKIIEKMATIMGQISQATAPEFKNPSMKAPNSSDGTQAHKLRGFIQSCQLIFNIIKQISTLTGRKFCTQLLFSSVKLANELNPTSPIFAMNILPTPSIIVSYLKLSYSVCLVIPMNSGKLNKSWTI
ncbi:hypothetical protein O181_072655 [Austropuccinia psidii MF-1]|uniref:Uncharacterized protein n=1 Tax=Austropuccinia psidii MF-1 TaxID=1389203 RepID=A0A9Q3F926_9BASI|nr:hypothetical protein [Austropuccinia psidii MF-1]